jgi:FlaA1/EpsC-like NDP-sugar epimerase
MKALLPRLTFRQLLVVVHDLVATTAAVLASFYLRFETDGLLARLDGLYLVLPIFLVYAAVVYQLFGLYKGKWRFASLPDLFNILRAVTVLAVSLLVLDYILVAPNFFGSFSTGFSRCSFWAGRAWLIASSAIRAPATRRARRNRIRP